MFETDNDRRLEEETRQLLEREWGVTLQKMDGITPVDWFAYRDRRAVGVVELKVRSHPSTQYPTVFMSVRKWWALTEVGYAFNCPGIFVVRFTDVMAWVGVDNVRLLPIELAGHNSPRARMDREPLIQVPVSCMTTMTLKEVSNVGLSEQRLSVDRSASRRSGQADGSSAAQ